jgi:hypothetical protein
MASIVEWNAAQRVACRHAETKYDSAKEPPFIKTVELVVCTHGVKRNDEDVTLMIYRIRLSDPATPSRHRGGFQYMGAELTLTLGAKSTGRPTPEPPKVLAWAPSKQFVIGDSDATSESDTTGLLGAKAVGTAEMKPGKGWQQRFLQQSYGNAWSSDRRIGTKPEVWWNFPSGHHYGDVLLEDFHLAIIVKPPQHASTLRALRFISVIEFDVKFERHGQWYDTSRSPDKHWYGSSRHNRAHTTPILFDPAMPSHFSGSGHRVRKLLQPNG